MKIGNLRNYYRSLLLDILKQQNPKTLFKDTYAKSETFCHFQKNQSCN